MPETYAQPGDTVPMLRLDINDMEDGDKVPDHPPHGLRLPLQARNPLRTSLLTRTNEG
jgi:hypothetical protein